MFRVCVLEKSCVYAASENSLKSRRLLPSPLLAARSMISRSSSERSHTPLMSHSASESESAPRSHRASNASRRLRNSMPSF